MPERIQRQRTIGWRMPEGAIYVGRPTLWGNPFYGLGAMPTYRYWLKFGDISAQAAFESTRHLYDGLKLVGHKGLTANDMLEHIWKLKGHDLVCWCPKTKQCHADVLLAMANG